jgi:hypothetical protein
MAYIPRLIQAAREQNKHTSDCDADGLYFENLLKLRGCTKDARKRLHYAMACLSYIEPFVRYQTRTYGSVPPSIPAIADALALQAINGARDQLEDIREVIDFLPGLQKFKDYRAMAAEAFLMLDLAAKVRAYLAEHPGTLQNKLKKAIEAQDGRLLSRVVHYMELAGQIGRKAEGRAWALYPRRCPS